MCINATQHIATHQEYLKKVASLESLLTAQAEQIALQTLKIDELNQEKGNLEEVITATKWAHINLRAQHTGALRKLKNALQKIEDLKEDVRIARLPKNSSNSSLAPSSDICRPKRRKNYSLRKSTKRKPGGQLGHPGTTLEFSTCPADQVIEHVMEACAACGSSLVDIKGEASQTHQVIDIAVPKKVIINHTIITKHCSCGHCNQADFPAGAKGQVNYGKGVRALVANLSTRQYIPYKRTVEFMEDIFGVSISQGTVTNLMDQFQQSAIPVYQNIQTQILNSPVVGSDETGAKVNGAKGWFHTYQNPEYTFIGYHYSRGAMAQRQFYPNGLPNSILVSDCFGMQLSTPAAGHQLCFAHLLRELNAMEEAHPKRVWPRKMKALLLRALELRGSPPNPKKIKVIHKKFDALIKMDQSDAPKKIRAFWKRMNKQKDSMFVFLEFPMVPSDNNASERAIRNIKVKQKVSGQFKTPEGAHRYAIIRSIIDTMIKQGQNVHQGLANIASLTPE